MPSPTPIINHNFDQFGKLVNKFKKFDKASVWEFENKLVVRFATIEAKTLQFSLDLANETVTINIFEQFQGYPRFEITIDRGQINGIEKDYQGDWSDDVNRNIAKTYSQKALKDIKSYLTVKEGEFNKEQARVEELNNVVLNKYDQSTIEVIRASELTDIHLKDKHHFGVSFIQHIGRDLTAFTSEIFGRVITFGKADDTGLKNYDTTKLPGKEISPTGRVRIVLEHGQTNDHSYRKPPSEPIQLPT